MSNLKNKHIIMWYLDMEVPSREGDDWLDVGMVMDLLLLGEWWTGCESK